MHSEASFKPPRESLTLNTSDRLIDELVGAWVFNETDSTVIRNYANLSAYGDATMQTTPTWCGSHWGSALRFVQASSDYATIPTYSGFRPTGYPFCLAARVKVTDLTTEAAIWTNDDTLNTLAGITLVCSTSGYYYVRLGDNKGTGSTHARTMPLVHAATVGDWNSIAFSITGYQNFTGFFNGVESTGVVGGSPLAVPAYGSSTNGGMGREDVSVSNPEVYSDHEIDYIYFWAPRRLTGDEALRLCHEPYSIFENRKRVFAYIAGSGWQHKLNNVSNASISKINGISKFVISKVSGVA